MQRKKRTILLRHILGYLPSTQWNDSGIIDRKKIEHHLIGNKEHHIVKIVTGHYKIRLFLFYAAVVFGFFLSTIFVLQIAYYLAHQELFYDGLFNIRWQEESWLSMMSYLIIILFMLTLNGINAWFRHPTFYDLAKDIESSFPEDRENLLFATLMYIDGNALGFRRTLVDQLYATFNDLKGMHWELSKIFFKRLIYNKTMLVFWLIIAFSGLAFITQPKIVSEGLVEVHKLVRNQVREIFAMTSITPDDNEMRHSIISSSFNPPMANHTAPRKWATNRIAPKAGRTIGRDHFSGSAVQLQATHPVSAATSLGEKGEDFLNSIKKQAKIDWSKVQGAKGVRAGTVILPDDYLIYIR